MEYIAFLVVALVCIVFIYLFGIAEEKKRDAWFRKKRANMYGQASDKKYGTNRFQSLYHSVKYHYQKRADLSDDELFMIDDITWNDLDMDRVFQSMDYTVSSAGEDALYRWLRIPEFELDILKRRDRHISFMEEHEKERLDYLMHMSKVGFSGKYTIYNYLDFLEVLSEKNCVKDKFIDCMIVILLILGIFVHTGFIFASIALMVYHGYDYFVQKHTIEPYFVSLTYLTKIIKASNPIQKMSDSFLNEFDEEMSQIALYRKEFSAFVRGASLALEITPQTGAGDLVQLFISYLYMVFHFDLIKFYSMLHIVNEKKDDMIALMMLMGEIEASVSVAYFRAQLPSCVKPKLEKLELKNADIIYHAEGIYHPLIKEPVRNDVHQDGCMLLTGSNASGKSTFLKTVALNALMAQSIYTACADTYRASFYQIYSSMALRDSLSEGESYFIVEIKSMKRIFDAVSKSKYPILCTIDEVLRGTNTAERIGASTELLKALSNRGVLCFAATHDLELTSYLQEHYDNYHFEEDVKEQDIYFPYKLSKGPAKSRNAIKLLQAYGFDQKIIEKANQLAGELS